MKKTIFLILITVFSLNISAQDTIQKMQLKHNGFVGVGFNSTKNYVIIEFPKKSKNNLYKNTLIYLTGIYNNPNEVISSVENELIVINGLNQSIRGELAFYEYQMYYNLKILFKDGKLKFEPIIKELIETWPQTNRVRNIYVASTDSPKKVEINCIWIYTKTKNDYILLNESLKISLDNWINNFILNLINGIQKDEW